MTSECACEDALSADERTRRTSAPAGALRIVGMPQADPDRWRHLQERWRRWAHSFMLSDPRMQVNQAMFPGFYSNDHSGRPSWVTGVDADALFNVFRPTSYEAIRKMWLGIGTGKGLNIKGKSAKQGALSAFVPYMQISQNEDVPLVAIGPSSARIRLYFQSEAARNEVVARLNGVRAEIMAEVEAASFSLGHKAVQAATQTTSAIASTTQHAISAASRLAHHSGHGHGHGHDQNSAAAHHTSASKKTNTGLGKTSIANAFHHHRHNPPSAAEPATTEPNAAPSAAPSAEPTVEPATNSHLKLSFSLGKTTSVAGAFRHHHPPPAAAPAASAPSSDEPVIDPAAEAAAQMIQRYGRGRIVRTRHEQGKASHKASAQMRRRWFMAKPTIELLDGFAPAAYGIDVPERITRKIRLHVAAALLHIFWSTPCRPS